MCSSPLTSVCRPFGRSTAFHPEGWYRGFLFLLCLLFHLPAVLAVDFTAQSACSMHETQGPGFLVSLMAFYELVFRERDRKIKGCASALCLILLTPIQIDWLHRVMRDLQLGENRFWPNGSKRGFSWMSNVIRALEQTDFVTHLWVCSLSFLLVGCSLMSPHFHFTRGLI